MLSPVIVERYKQIIDENLDDDLETDPYQKLSHLKWMLDEIAGNDTQSITKKHRWLGFVQGILIAKKLTTVDTERDFTRDLFDGD